MAEEAKFFYANGAEMGLTPYDMTFRFFRNGNNSPTVGDPPADANSPTTASPVILDALSVTMSMSHAKTVVMSMIRLIEIYESNYGEVPVAPDVRVNWNARLNQRGDSDGA